MEDLLLLNCWRKELQIAVESMNVNKFRKFLSRWADKGFYEFSIYSEMEDEVMETAMRKMAVSMTGIKPAVKEEAEAWLLERGFDLSM